MRTWVLETMLLVREAMDSSEKGTPFKTTSLVEESFLAMDFRTLRRCFCWYFVVEFVMGYVKQTV